MKQQLQAFIAEVHKNRHSKITWITFIAFFLGPVFGGVFMLLMKNDRYGGLSGVFQAKAALMSFEANWDSFLSLLAQTVGIGGVIIFGFVASWLFGREYSEGTAKDLLSLPMSRTKIVHAKFMYYLISIDFCPKWISSDRISIQVMAYIIFYNRWVQRCFSKSV